MNSRPLSICSLVAVVVFVACAPAGRPTAIGPSEPGSSQPRVLKKVTAAIRGDPPTLNEKLSRAGAGRVYGVKEIQNLLHVGLLIEDDQVELRPALAEAVPTVETGLWRVLADGRMETTWKIRAGAQWHDGTAFTSDDLVFTAMVVQDKQLTEFADVAFESIEAVDAPDSRTITVRWKKPFIWANTMFSDIRAIPHPKHVLERTYLEDRAAYTQHSQWNEALIGTGAFRLKEFARSSHLLLEANDRFVLGRPRIDEIEVRLLQDANALAASILSGVVHLTLVAQGALSIEQALQVRDQWRDGRVESVLSGSVGTFPQFLNPSPPVILEVRFRRALLQAIDRQLLVDSLQGGLSSVAHTNFTPGQPEFKDIEGSIVRYSYDPRRAQEAIEGLGYARGADGVFRDGTGQRLAVELRSTPGREVNEKTTFIVADHWQAAGVAVETVLIPLQRNSDREYRQTRPAFEVVGQPDDVYRFHSNQIPLPETRFVGDNRPRYANAQLDALVDRYYVTIPRGERVQVLGQIINHVTDQLVLLPFFYEASPLMIGNRMKNVTIVPTWNSHEWDVAL